ncbi:MAG: glycosyltransferase [Caldisericia bacterium]|nr:glycosyltransferase [Caldisericia bacterium]
MKQSFNPKVSIVIPVYNGSNYLREAIDSALAQTYRNIEIIVVNDGSNDNGATERVAKSYGKKIRYFKKENGGTSTALNVGIKHMKGEYFSWLSHDDMYYPKKIQRQVEELAKLEDRNTIMMTDLDGIDENYNKIYETHYIENIKAYPPREKSNIYPIVYNQTHGCTLLIPKSCFDEVGLFDEDCKVAQDFEFFYRAFSQFPHKLIPEILVTARDTSGRQGRRNKQGANVEYSDLYIKIIKNLSDEDIKLLAPSKIDFYLDMLYFFSAVGYTYAWKFLRKKIIKNLQISSYDLMGNKFNGYDLHLDLRKKGIDSKQYVLYKQSADKDTIQFDFLAKDSTKSLILQKDFYETDVVHMHLIHNILDLNYLPIITRLKPTVITLHDPFFLGGHCVHHFDCEKWQSQCRDCPYLGELFPLDRDYSSLNFELKRQAIQNSQITAIVASRWMEEKVKKSPIWKDKKIYFLPFGVNQEIFKPGDKKIIRKELKIDRDSLVIMLRARPGSFKGMNTILESLSKMRTNRKITLITVDEIGLLNQLSSKYNIIEYGWINDDQLLSKLYQVSDIFLMPSKQETFGMMAAEAMSCGVMVLAIQSDGSALPEVINSPICGLAPKENDFTKVLQFLINEPKEIASRGEASLEFAKKHYSGEHYVTEIIKIYREVMRNHVLDKESQVILQQLKKYPVSIIQNNQPIQKRDLDVINSFIKEKSFIRELYRKILPLEVRKRILNKIHNVLKK